MKTIDVTGLENGSRGRDEQDDQGRSTDGATLEEQANLLQGQPTKAPEPVKVKERKLPAAARNASGPPVKV